MQGRRTKYYQLTDSAKLAVLEKILSATAADEFHFPKYGYETASDFSPHRVTADLYRSKSYKSIDDSTVVSCIK